MEIIPFIGDAKVATDAFRIEVDPSDKERVNALLARAIEVVLVNNNDTFAIGKRVAGQLKAMLQEISDSKKAAKRPFGAVETGIEGLAVQFSRPDETENKRVLSQITHND